MSAPVRRALVCLITCLAPAAGLACAPDQVTLRLDGNQVRFEVEVADDAQERARGLMFREDMPLTDGMLFVYERPQPVAFWMKNTLIPLDMLFLDQTGTVRRIARMTTPLSTESVPGGNDILMVLEINGGASDLFGLAEGAELQHPALDQSLAAWPCAD